jgi:gamma-glutamyltranspeptidase/glutathione hydrolase
MRFHHQYLPDLLMFEPDTFSPALQKSLQAMGYQLMPMDHYYGDMQAITWDKGLNLLTSASDPRHIGRGTTVVSQQTGHYGLKP